MRPKYERLLRAGLVEAQRRFPRAQIVLIALEQDEPWWRPIVGPRIRVMEEPFDRGSVVSILAALAGIRRSIEESHIALWLGNSLGEEGFTLVRGSRLRRRLNRLKPELCAQIDSYWASNRRPQLDQLYPFLEAWDLLHEELAQVVECSGPASCSKVSAVEEERSLVKLRKGAHQPSTPRPYAQLPRRKSASAGANSGLVA